MNSEILHDAIKIVNDWHFGVNRKNPINNVYLPFITHPIEVMKLVWTWGVDEDTCLAALCHDVIEDTKITEVDIKNCFGEKVCSIVKELTKLPEDDKIEYMNRFYTSSVEALVIKIADRNRNLLDFMRSDPKYASKYFGKALPLFDAMHKRSSDISKRFGYDTCKAIEKSYSELINQLGPFHISRTFFSGLKN